MATTEVGLAPSEDIPASITPRQRWIDLAFVVGVALWQPLFTSTVTVVRGPTVSSGSTLRVTYALLQEFSSLGVLAYVLWRRGTGLRSITNPFRAADLLRGAILYAVARAAEWIAWPILGRFWAAALGGPPQHVAVNQILGLHLSAAWLLFQFVNPWWEELIVRGFLMTEIAALAGMPAAILTSALLQASYHLYQGPVNAALALVVFLIFSIDYASTRRLYPIIVAHTIMDVRALFYYAHW